MTALTLRCSSVTLLCLGWFVSVGAQNIVTRLKLKIIYRSVTTRVCRISPGMAGGGLFMEERERERQRDRETITKTKKRQREKSRNVIEVVSTMMFPFFCSFLYSGVCSNL